MAGAIKPLSQGIGDMSFDGMVFIRACIIVQVFLFSSVCLANSLANKDQGENEASAQIKISTPVANTGAEDVSRHKLAAQVDTIANRIDAVRRVLGDDKIDQGLLLAKEISVFEVYSAAKMLHIKVSHLSYEWTSNVARKSSSPKNPISLQDIEHLLALVDAELNLVFSRLDMEPDSNSPGSVVAETASTSSLSEIYNRLMQVNRQLSHMLARPVLSSDIYEQVIVAINYASSLRAFSEGQALPLPVPYSPYKTHKDVYLHLQQCYRQAERVAHWLGYTIPSLNSAVDVDQAGKRDSLDLAQALTEELAYLRLLVTGISRREAPFYAGKKIPSDVFQRAEQLLLQLDSLDRHFDLAQSTDG